ncbi:translocation/assembly module TamB domain-containing protein [Acidicapsa dinghuensis]|uniref:Translocation/assembly module TamB domain-containing protein n=1 Tax=Acidicapsa dinghuensis TaxID=2218256 RepID=A0ABW1ED55_9BACT|nr:translocation/assembly module TamB domain-containing protein [Acidicapsa dinghuensis]
MSDEKPNIHANKKKRSFWLKVAIWAGASILLLILIVGVTLSILLHSERFHNYMLRTAQQKATEALGVPVRLQNFAVNLSHLDLDLYGLTVEGAAPYANPALLQVDHAEAGVRIVSFLQRTWYLNSIRVDRPIVHLYVDKQGRSNLPTFQKSSSSSSNTSVFDLGIRHAILDRGEVYYNDHRSDLSADLHNLAFEASFNSLLQKYSGKLSYQDGHVISGAYRPIPHSLAAEFDATRTAFHLMHAELQSGQSRLTLQASMQNYSQPNVQAHYDLVTIGNQWAQLLKLSSIPSGEVHASGDFQYQQNPSHSLIESIGLNGELDSKALVVKTASLRTQASNLVAHYSLASGNATLNDLHFNILGGYLTSSGSLTNLVGSQHANFSANLRGVSLARLENIAGRPTSVQNVAVSGYVNSKFTAEWVNSVSSLIAHADVTLDGQVQKAHSASAAAANNAASGAQPTVPIDGVVHAVYRNDDKQLAVSNSYVRTPQTNITLNGTISKHSSLSFDVQAQDLAEIESIANLFRTQSSGQPNPSLGLSGVASVHGSIDGIISAPHITGEFTSTNLHIAGSEWRLIHTNFAADPSNVVIQNADLQPALRGRITLSASAGLNKWSFEKTSPVQIDLNAAQLNIADFEKLTGKAIPVTGTLNAAVKLHGSELHPVGNGNLSITHLTAYDQPVDSLKVDFSGTGEEAQASLDIQLAAGTIHGSVSTRPADRTYSAQLAADKVDLSKVQILKARNLEATGQVTLHAKGQGTYNNPAVDANIEIPKLVVQHETISGITLNASLANHIANATLASSAISTKIQAKARVELTGDYPADASIDTQAIPFAPLLAAYAPEEAADITGQTELHATLHGPLKNRSQLEAHVTIPVLNANYAKTVQIAATSPIHVDYKDGVVNVQRTSIRGTDTDLQLQGSIPINGLAPSSAQIAVMLQGTVNLQLIQLFDPDLRSSGELKFNVNSTGAANGSSFGGQVEVVNAALSSVDLPVGLQHGNGTITLTPNRLNINKFEGTVGGGTVTAQGGIALRPRLQFDLGLNGRGIRMLYPQAMRETANANVRLSGSPESAILSGSINLSDLSFTPAFDLSSFIAQFSGGVATPPTPGFSQNLQLNLSLRSSNDIDLVSRTLSVNGNANLQVRGTASNPVILGRVNLNNGDVILNGDRFVLNGGTIEFVNPSETQPVLNVSLKTTIQQYDIYLRFNGPSDQLRTEYNSDPALPSADIINLLAFGQTTEANSANASTPANQAAESLIASQVSSQITSRVAKIAGISQLSINPILNAGNSSSTADATVTIQQRVTGNLFVTFSTNVASTQNQTIQGQYQLNRRVALSATRDQNGGVAFDALIKKSW